MSDQFFSSVLSYNVTNSRMSTYRSTLSSQIMATRPHSLVHQIKEDDLLQGNKNAGKIKIRAADQVVQLHDSNFYQQRPPSIKALNESCMPLLCPRTRLMSQELMDTHGRLSSPLPIIVHFSICLKILMNMLVHL
jgi:hypothetical protein